MGHRKFKHQPRTWRSQKKKKKSGSGLLVFTLLFTFLLFPLTLCLWWNGRMSFIWNPVAVTQQRGWEYLKCHPGNSGPSPFFAKNAFSLKITPPGSVPLGEGRGSAKRNEVEVMEKGKPAQTHIWELAASVEEGWKKGLGFPSLLLVVQHPLGWGGDWKLSSALDFFPQTSLFQVMIITI